MRVTVEGTEVDRLLDGLRAPQKTVSSKYFYDTRGSELFEAITRLDEYYPTRTERGLLELWMPRWIPSLRPTTLVELGAGSGEKTRIILRELEGLGPGKNGARTYRPVDVSQEFLGQAAEVLQDEFAGLRVRPLVADFTRPLPLDDEGRPLLIAFLGGTLGNFHPRGARRLLRAVRSDLEPGDAFLLGVDLRPGRFKTLGRIERAYNDSQGVTAAFNLNLLRVLNERFDATFDPADFRHRAYYDPDRGRIEMHLVARRSVVVTVADERITFDEGESLRTEISCKYDRETLTELFTASGLGMREWRTDPEELFALVLASPASPTGPGSESLSPAAPR